MKKDIYLNIDRNVNKISGRWYGKGGCVAIMVVGYFMVMPVHASFLGGYFQKSQTASMATSKGDVKGSSTTVVSGNFSCQLPANLPAPVYNTHIDCRNDARPDSYVMALSWSPEFCSHGNPHSYKNHFQCSDNKFGFVEHGLWPDIAAAHGSMCAEPRNCGTDSSVVDTNVVAATLCTIPGVQLIQDEWQKHGTCSGLSQAAYFGKARQLYSSIKKPDMVHLIGEKNGNVTAGDIAQAFVDANKDIGLPYNAVAVQVGSHNHFSEVVICYDLNFKFRECSTSKTPDTQRVWVQKPRDSYDNGSGGDDSNNGSGYGDYNGGSSRPHYRNSYPNGNLNN